MHLVMHLGFRISLRTFLLTLAPRVYATYYQARGLHRYDASGDASWFQNFSEDFSFDPGTTCLRHLLLGSETKWATSPCGEYACFYEVYTFQKSKVGTLHQEKSFLT